MESASTSLLSSHPPESTSFWSSGLNKEWQINGETGIGQWVAGADNKSSLAPGAFVPNRTKISKCYSQSMYANINPSSNDYGDGGTNAFSSSFTALFSSKLQLLDPKEPLSQSANSAVVDLNGEIDTDENFSCSKELESHAIGNLLPDDEDVLLAEVTDNLSYMFSSQIVNDTEDFELFSSGGGMELECDVSASLGLYINSNKTMTIWAGYPPIQHSGPPSLAGEHPYGEHPSRTLFVRNINSNVEDSELRNIFEQYGDIRTLYTACKHRGFVMISYYDIRAARSAMRALQNKPLRRRKLDIHFSIPKDNPSEKDVNQGTLVVFNLDSSVSNDELRQIFGVYGEIKEIRETPHKRHHKFVEYYDVRAAEAALWALNRSDIAGKRIKLEPSRPGGARRSLMQQLSMELEQEEIQPQRQQAHSPLSHSPSGHPSHQPIVHLGDVPNRSSHHIPDPANLNASIHSWSNKMVANSTPCMSSTNIGSIASQFGHFNQLEESLFGSPNMQHQMLPYHPNSLPEFSRTAGSYAQNGYLPSFSSSLRAKNRAEGCQFQRSANGGNIDMPDFDHGKGLAGVSGGPSPPIVWTTSAANTYENFDRSRPQPQPQPQPHPFLNPRVHLKDALVSAHYQHIGSAPGNFTGMDIQHGYFANSPNISSLPGSGSFGAMGMGLHAAHVPNMIGSYGIVDFGVSMANVGGKDYRIPSVGGLMSAQQRTRFFSNGGPAVAFMDGGFYDRGRNRQGDVSSAQADNKKQYQLDLDRLLRGEDHRTTLMIKNIPNKYTAKMLLAAIDEHHHGTYDFMYLPIDFKNKCNVGYAFINMIDHSHIVPFYQAFNGKKWEKFNSEKVASLAYARIQGKAALVAHFQNSSLMNEDKRCRPILFHTDGPNVGDQEPFPVGINVHRRSSNDSSSSGSTRPGSPGSNSSSSSNSSNDESVLGSQNFVSAKSTQILQAASRN